MSKADLIPPPSKMQRGRKTRALALTPARDIEGRTKEIIRHHEAAGQHAVMASVHAALAGLELQAARAELPHGEFERWVEASIPFTTRTAQRYMALAEGIKKLCTKTTHVSFLENLFSVAPSELPEKNRAALIETLAKATDGQSLREWYIELGIIKEPKAVGGYNGRRDIPPEERLRIKREAAKRDWGQLYKSINAIGIKDPLWMELSRAEIVTIAEVLDDVLAAMKKFLKEA